MVMYCKIYISKEIKQNFRVKCENRCQRDLKYLDKTQKIQENSNIQIKLGDTRDLYISTIYTKSTDIWHVLHMLGNQIKSFFLDYLINNFPLWSQKCTDVVFSENTLKVALWQFLKKIVFPLMKKKTKKLPIFIHLWPVWYKNASNLWCASD